MPKPTIHDIVKLKDPIFSDSFLLEIYMPGGKTKKLLNVSCKTVSIPETTIAQLTYNLYGHKVHHPGTRSVSGTLSAEFIESGNMMVYTEISKWLDVVKFFPDQYGGEKHEFSTRAVLKVFDTSGKEIGKHEIQGIWPMSIETINFDATNSATLSVNVTFSFDSINAIEIKNHVYTSPETTEFDFSGILAG